MTKYILLGIVGGCILSYISYKAIEYYKEVELDKFMMDWDYE